MLTPAIAGTIKDFVRQEPRTIDEIAKRISKAWLTADRYVQRIAEQDGSLRIKTFRGGTRGALKLVYWNSTNMPAQSSVQEKLFNMIMRGRKKTDFSPLDIYQFVDQSRRSATITQEKEDNTLLSKDLAAMLSRATKQILIFSGNLSWSNLRRGKHTLLSLVESLAKQGVSIKILSRVDVAGIDNIRRMLALNQRIGKDMIEVRHCEQPLRSFIVDDEIMQFKEIKNPKDYKPGELATVTKIYYTINDPDWIIWAQRIFWYFFAEAVSAQMRMAVLKELKA